jgi:hypothetical protein
MLFSRIEKPSRPDNESTSKSSMTIDPFRSVPHRDHVPEVRYDGVDIHLRFDLPEFCFAEQHLEALARLLVERENAASPVVISPGALVHQAVDRVFLDAALLHPCDGMLGQRFHRITSIAH